METEFSSALDGVTSRVSRALSPSSIRASAALLSPTRLRDERRRQEAAVAIQGLFRIRAATLEVRAKKKVCGCLRHPRSLPGGGSYGVGGWVGGGGGGSRALRGERASGRTTNQLEPLRRGVARGSHRSPPPHETASSGSQVDPRSARKRGAVESLISSLAKPFARALCRRGVSSILELRSVEVVSAKGSPLSGCRSTPPDRPLNGGRGRRAPPGPGARKRSSSGGGPASVALPRASVVGLLAALAPTGPPSPRR